MPYVCTPESFMLVVQIREINQPSVVFNLSGPLSCERRGFSMLTPRSSSTYTISSNVEIESISKSSIKVASSEMLPFGHSKTSTRKLVIFSLTSSSSTRYLLHSKGTVFAVSSPWSDSATFALADGCYHPANTQLLHSAERWCFLAVHGLLPLATLSIPSVLLRCDTHIRREFARPPHQKFKFFRLLTLCI